MGQGEERSQHKFSITDPAYPFTTVDLPGAQVIGISAVSRTGRGRVQSTIRFQLRDHDAMAIEPFNAVSAWYQEEAAVTLKIDDLEPITACKVRECALDLHNKVLYIHLYLPVSAQQVQHWLTT